MEFPCSVVSKILAVTGARYQSAHYVTMQGCELSNQLDLVANHVTRHHTDSAGTNIISVATSIMELLDTT